MSRTLAKGGLMHIRNPLYRRRQKINESIKSVLPRNRLNQSFESFAKSTDPLQPARSAQAAVGRYSLKMQ